MGGIIVYYYKYPLMCLIALTYVQLAYFCLLLHQNFYEDNEVQRREVINEMTVLTTIHHLIWFSGQVFSA